MGNISVKTETVKNIVSLYWNQPTRWVEVLEWVRKRRTDPYRLEEPWWPFILRNHLESKLQIGAKVFEFGGGGSTLWMVERGADVTTVEHIQDWYQHIQSVVGDRADIIFAPSSSVGRIDSESEAGRYFDLYVATIYQQIDQSLDLVIVDGRARLECILAAKAKVKPGGMLLLDDSNRPRYSTADELLAGWVREDFFGVKMGGGGPVQSSIWRRPANET